MIAIPPSRTNGDCTTSSKHSVGTASRPTMSLLSTLDAFQLVSGFVTPVLSSPAIEIDYVGIGWLPHIRNRLRALDGQLEVEKAWSPSLQRVNDDSIMEHIAACHRLTPKERRLANEFCLYIRVTCISCLASLDGRGIPYDHLTGGWRADPIPEMRWPDLPQPTPGHCSNLGGPISQTGPITKDSR